MASAPAVPPPPPPPGDPAGAVRPAPEAEAPAAEKPPAELPPALPRVKPEPTRGEPPPLPPVKLDPLAALLSLLIPGLGQVYQGRIGKGLLFFLGLYTLFIYGMWMGQWRNVWLPDAADLPEVELAGQKLDGVLKALAYRPQYAGQFWIGIAAWPATIQYRNFDKNEPAGPVFGAFQRSPSEKELNDLQRNGDKRWDLGWVYTVIAGVLNLLVIYDALAGPMFRESPPGWEKKDDEVGW